MTLFSAAFVFTVIIVCVKLPWVKAATILCCYSLHSSKVFASCDNKPSSVTWDWEIKSAFCRWLTHFTALTAAQSVVCSWDHAASLFALDHCVCTPFSLPQEGDLQLYNEPTATETIYFRSCSFLTCISFLIVCGFCIILFIHFADFTPSRKRPLKR